MAPSTEPRSARDQLPSRSLPVTVRRFLDTEAAGGVALVAAAVLALIWANSPWRDSYQSLWESRVTLRLGTFGLDEDLRHFVDDGLMALFFVVVSLEIKRELVTGDLRDRRVAALPVVAAAGGMVVPAALYLAVNPSGANANGWGIPMATDIAFAIGVLALLGPRCPTPLKVFLLSLAIVDDIGAIVVIAVFYSDDIDLAALGLAVVAIAAAAALRGARVWWPPVFVVLGLACWLATYNSGVHPTLAGVAFGLLTPARPLAPAEVARSWAHDLSDEPTARELRQLTTIAKETVSVAERVQNVLHPITSFVVVPVFALANAGIPLTTDDLGASAPRSVAIGVALGLLAGKTVGITAASAVAVWLRLAKLPDQVRWPELFGTAAIAGIGFTVSLFITGLAFDEVELQNAARLAILATSVAAAGLGTAVLRYATRGGPRA